MPSQWNQVAPDSTRISTPMVQVIMPYLKLSETVNWLVEKSTTLGFPLMGRPTTQSMQRAAGCASDRGFLEPQFFRGLESEGQD